MKFETITLTKKDHIATITLNRPEKYNAISTLMGQELPKALEDVRQDDNIRVFILTGAGKAFCGGADIECGSWANEGIPPGSSPEFMRRTMLKGLMVSVRMIFNMEKPSIAMINGAAVAGGLDYALSCDIRIGSDTSKFKIAYTRVGLFPDLGGTWLLPRVVGLAKAAELIYTADLFDAKEAERIGILNRVVPAVDLEKATMELANKIADNPPIALRLAKIQLHRGLLWDLDTALDVEAATVPICMSSKDSMEGIAAFLEKRKPIFKGE